VLPASQASDGVLIVLAYLAVMHLPTPPALILIEEPENGIHPKRLQEIVHILRALVEQNGHTQMLMTSHSPYLLDEFQPDEVTLCRKNRNGAVQTRRLSEIEQVCSQLDVFSLGEIWTGEGDERLAGAAPAMRPNRRCKRPFPEAGESTDNKTALVHPMDTCNH